MGKSQSRDMTMEERLSYLLHPPKLERMKKRRHTHKSIKIGDVPIPSIYSLYEKVREVYDQGPTQSCTACAICAAFSLMNEKDKSFSPSRYYIYARERQMESEFISSNTLIDDGAYESDGLLWAESYGICSETIWPSIDINKVPPTSCDIDACRHRIRGLISIPIDIDSMRRTISSGRPILAAIYLYLSLSSSDISTTGIMPLPTPDDIVVGGHEVLIVGYEHDHQRFVVLNSWSKNWGVQPQGASTRGYFYLSYDYIMKHVMSLYTFDSIIII